MVRSELQDKTMEFLVELKKEKNIEEFDFQKIAEMLCQKVLQQDTEKVNLEIEKMMQSKDNCNACGVPLEHWEKEICGPCKIKDPRFKDETDE